MERKREESFFFFFFFRLTCERKLWQRPVCSEILLICGQKFDQFCNTLLQNECIILNVQDF